MKRFGTSVLALLLCWQVFSFQSATACPNCRDATKASPGASCESQFREAQAFNRSIYLMAGMPFMLLGGFGFAIYFLSRAKSANQTL